MKYISKIPDTDINLNKDMLSTGWKMLKEPRNLVTATLISLPISIINIYLCIFFIKLINKDLLTIINSIFYDGKFVFTIKLIYIKRQGLFIKSNTLISVFLFSINSWPVDFSSTFCFMFNKLLFLFNIGFSIVIAFSPNI